MHPFIFIHPHTLHSQAVDEAWGSFSGDLGGPVPVPTKLAKSRGTLVGYKLSYANPRIEKLFQILFLFCRFSFLLSSMSSFYLLTFLLTSLLPGNHCFLHLLASSGGVSRVTSRSVGVRSQKQTH